MQKVLTHSKVFSRVRQKMGGMRQRFAASDHQVSPSPSSSSDLVGPPSVSADGGTGTGTGFDDGRGPPDVIRSVDEYRRFFRTMDGAGAGAGAGGPPLLPSFDTSKLTSLVDQVT